MKKKKREKPRRAMETNEEEKRGAYNGFKEKECQKDIETFA